MSLVSHGKYRDYALKFDHEEAVRRVWSGESIGAVARSYGVHYDSVSRLVNPKVDERLRRNSKAFYTAECEACGGPCLSIRHPAKYKNNPDGRELCNRCRSDEKIERLEFDLETGALVAVRCHMLDCANGERWQTPDNFTRGVRFRWLREGGIHGQCRACQTRTKRLYRARHPEAS